ncbi:hypothetical protein DKL51_08530 [Micromonospora globispora]|nr:hypothetical protein DKL51_08530 [Micromonospora globispora]
MPLWRPSGFDLTPATLLKVSASDVDSDRICPQHAYVKTHVDSQIIGAHGWSKTYDPEDIPLKQFLAALDRFHAERRSGASFASAQSAAAAAIRPPHPGLRAYLSRALDNYLDFFESREEAHATPLHYLGHNLTRRTTQRGALFFWGAPTYRSSAGDVEVHRLRIKKARPDITGWALLAAYVVSQLGGRPANSVTVMDVSLYHSSLIRHNEAMLLERVSPAEAEDLFQASARPRALELIEGGDPTPGRDCASCKAAGVCNALIPMDGVLGQVEKGPYTRSVSATDLRIYERCPARWYMQQKLHLPADEEAESHGADADRGRAVHLWLKIAHSRGLRCGEADLPDVREPHHVAASELDDDSYRAALPFLRQHLEHCPMSQSVRILSADERHYGWDVTADTVVVSKPDLLYMRDGNLVVRETKTTNLGLPENEASARDSFDEIVYWLLSLLDRGWRQRYGVESATVELEVLGHSGSALYSYSTTDSTLMLIADTRVMHRVAGWHYDTEWATKPSEHCRTCPMALWCPDRERYLDTPPDGSTHFEEMGAAL